MTPPADEVARLASSYEAQERERRAFCKWWDELAKPSSAVVAKATAFAAWQARASLPSTPEAPPCSLLDAIEDGLASGAMLATRRLRAAAIAAQLRPWFAKRGSLPSTPSEAEVERVAGLAWAAFSDHKGPPVTTVAMLTRDAQEPWRRVARAVLSRVPPSSKPVVVGADRLDATRAIIEELRAEAARLWEAKQYAGDSISTKSWGYSDAVRYLEEGLARDFGRDAVFPRPVPPAPRTPAVPPSSGEEGAVSQLVEAARLMVEVDGPDRTWSERKGNHERLHKALRAVESSRAPDAPAKAREGL